MGRAERDNRLSLCESIRARQREGRFPVISEIKVRSAKEGDLLRGRDPVALARQMAHVQIAAISVVTESKHFGGSIDLLHAVAAAVDVPVLHKDFITTERQLSESAAHGASAVLLIAEMLEPDARVRLIDAARRNGLEILFEAHSVAEVEAIQPLSFDLMGINNRDITILEVDDEDVSRTEALVSRCRGPRLVVSESSIRNAAEVRRAAKSGADAVLVGTAVLQAEEPRGLLQQLVSVGWPVR